MPIRPENPGPDAWEALHQGADREQLDSPARFKLDRAAVLMRVRSLHARQRPSAGGRHTRADERPPLPRTEPPLLPEPVESGGRRRRRALPGDQSWPAQPAPRWPDESDVSRDWPGDAPVADWPPAREWPDAQRDWPRQPSAREWETATIPAATEWPGASAPAPTAVRQRTMMRPYAHTRGRTRPDYELALETLVSTSERGRRYQGAASVQHRRICDLCVEPRSIAEIAAFLHLPLNVVKVLVSDMDNLELVVLHQPGLSFGDRSSREFMARVLEGLRAL
ncbi:MULTISPECIES: DUF742 domain-containing protein [Amycolatopsis]|uniref:DUF742 domain-containing protein n=2 Tax=Amycolatopsis TaxID=1813 RepID=A0A1I4B5D2_9PSEU|nr:DUF742 domain-containing protein [Amycolatopsis sacchari]SFK63066.1 Protein of unknown function [Amycolatopsis sacchari]